jgi:hypothetical protein
MEKKVIQWFERVYGRAPTDRGRMLGELMNPLHPDGNPLRNVVQHPAFCKPELMICNLNKY